MLTPPKTCKCGQTWRWSSSEPSPITPDGCPTCHEPANQAMLERNRISCLEAISGQRALAEAARTP